MIKALNALDHDEWSLDHDFWYLKLDSCLLHSMKNIISTLRTFIGRDSWIYLVPVLFFSYVYMQQSHHESLLVYSGLLLALFVMAIPALFWSWWDNTDRRPAIRLLLWVVAFIGFPLILVFGFGWGIDELPFVRKGISYQPFPGNLGIVPYFFIQAILGAWLSLRNNRWRTFNLELISEKNIPRIALGILLLFSFVLVLGSNSFQDRVREMGFLAKAWLYLFAVMQAVIVFGSYYLIYYVHHNWLFNQLLRKRGLLFYLVGSLGFLLFFVPIQNGFISLIPAVNQYKIHPVGIVPDILDQLNYTLPLAFFILSIPFIVVVEWFRQQRTLSLLENEKSATELQLLKQQINPHFFFNTLNNLYAMSLTQDQETPEVILKLSELMRYVIYKGQEDEVALQQELDYLQGYLDLQKLRQHQELKVDFQIEVEDPEVTIPPLLFIILLENAFKHGIEPTGGAGFLQIICRQSKGELYFKCENSLDPEHEQEKSPGIGLQNLHRRLSLRFPGRHELITTPSADRYSATLKLVL